MRLVNHLIEKSIERFEEEKINKRFDFPRFYFALGLVCALTKRKLERSDIIYRNKLWYWYQFGALDKALKNPKIIANEKRDEDWLGEVKIKENQIREKIFFELQRLANEDYNKFIIPFLQEIKKEEEVVEERIDESVIGVLKYE